VRLSSIREVTWTMPRRKRLRVVEQGFDSERVPAGPVLAEEVIGDGNVLGLVGWCRC